jgi:uncharacterized RDD family membrane protein YckC
MPFHVKFGLTLAVVLAALGGWFLMGHLGQPGPQHAVAFLGPFTVLSLWVFPEVTRRPGETPHGKG